MEIHFSIDDVIFSLQELTTRNYKSIFNHPFYAFLRRLHKRYGCVFSLYVFAQKNGFAIEDMTCRFREEFLANSDWLRFGYHGESASATSDLCYQYSRINKAIERFSGQSRICRTIRIHGFNATKNEVIYLSKNDLRCLLCADDDRVSYDLSHEEDKELKSYGCISKDGVIYRRSDVRIEKHSIKSLLKYRAKENKLVIFTHEWCLYSFRKPLTELKINLILRKISKESTQFVFDLSGVE